MYDLESIKFETINNEIYINVKDVFKVYTAEKSKAFTFLTAFCRTNNQKLKFCEYLLFDDFFDIFKKYTPKQEDYKYRHLEILDFIQQQANKLKNICE